MSRPGIDRAFLLLLVLDTAVAVLVFAETGFSPLFIDLFPVGSGMRGIVLSLISAKLTASALLLLHAARWRASTTAPSRLFLLLAAAGFFLLGILPLTAAISLSRLILPALTGVLLFFFGGRSLGRLWRYYRQECLIFLAGAWVLLFGSVGVDLLGGIFQSGGRLLVAALEGFCRLAGASILFYGALRFVLRRRYFERFLWC